MHDYGIAKLSRDTGISRSNIYGIIDGTIEPKISTIEKILNILGYELILTSKKNKKPSLLDQAYLRWSLIQYGAPLSSDQEFNHKPDINELLIETLKHGRT